MSLSTVPNRRPQMKQSIKSQGLRIVFAGTPDFAAHQLQALLDSGEHQLVAAYTQPDRPAGRGKKLSPGPVKQLALAHDIPVFQPESLKGEAARAELAALNADVMVVVAYGLLLPQAVLDIPRLGCVNVHASLLPRWRGAAPIQRAIEAGDRKTGVTIMQMDAGLDTGAMLLKAECPIEATDTASDLHDRLAKISAPALLETLRLLQEGRAQPQAQDNTHSTYAAKISKAEAELDWRSSAEQLARQVRAFNPFPIAFTRKSDGEERIRIWKAQATEASHGSAPGKILALDSTGLEVACGKGSLLITEVQLPGKKAMPVEALVRGHPDYFSVGESLALPAAKAEV